MKVVKKHWASILGVVILICAGISYFLLEQKLIGFLAFMISAVGFVKDLIQSLNQGKGDKNKEEYEDIVSHYKARYFEERAKYLNEAKKSKKLSSGKKRAEFEKAELSKFLDKVNETLQKENISKSELIKSTHSSLKAILFYKTWEDTSQKRALFFNKVYPELGVYSIRAGVAILPPKRVPQDLPNNKILEWFEKEIAKRVPRDYEYNIPIMSIINLNETKYLKTLKPFRKFQLSYLDKIPIEELIPTKEIMTYLHKKKHLASRDVIEIPNIVFLVEDYLTSKSDLEVLKEKNNEIIEKIKKAVGSEQIKTTDLALVEEDILRNILEKYVSKPDEIAKRIKENAAFWKAYFEHRLEIKHK